MGNNDKIVLVSGCFDLLHSGHVQFFEQAAKHGQLHVAIGSDATVAGLKNRLPINSEQERLFMVSSCRHVHAAFVSSGSGLLDFRPDALLLKPDLFCVNWDGHSDLKQQFVEQELGAAYVVLDRVPAPGLVARSTTDLRKLDAFPYRIDLAGGWLDQPWVSKLHAGPVITVGLNPTNQYNERSGMATSTRKKMKEIFNVSRFLCSGSYSAAAATAAADVPATATAAAAVPATAADAAAVPATAADASASSSSSPSLALESAAKLLFRWDNPPGTETVSGAQDSIGLVFPGLACSMFAGDYWPSVIDRITDQQTLSFVEHSIRLIPLEPRVSEFNVFDGKNVTAAGAAQLADAATRCWTALQRRDVKLFGAAVTDSFKAQIEMFPAMTSPSIDRLIEKFRPHPQVYGWKVSGAGGGGYLILICDQTVCIDPTELRISVRR